MKDGDEVIVLFEDNDEPIYGVLVDHFEDWRNVTVKTPDGGTINGMIRDIKEASLFK